MRSRYYRRTMRVQGNVGLFGTRESLVILAKDTSGNPYVAVILKCSERGILYQEMTDLLTEINN